MQARDRAVIKPPTAGRVAARIWLKASDSQREKKKKKVLVAEHSELGIQRAA